MKLKLWIALVVVFVSGIAIGFIAGEALCRRRVHEMLRRRQAPLKKLVLRRLRKKLHLEPDQVPAVRKVIEKAWQNLDQMHRRQRRMFRSHMEGILKDIRPLLRPEQQAMLDRMGVEDLRPRPGRRGKQRR